MSDLLSLRVLSPEEYREGTSARAARYNKLAVHESGCSDSSFSVDLPIDNQDQALRNMISGARQQGISFLFVSAVRNPIDPEKVTIHIQTQGENTQRFDRYLETCVYN